MINGNHRPRSRDGELYSKRIEALVYMRNIDLYGRGWTKWLSKESIWFPYWKNRKRILSVYHGECTSKSEVLSRYRFCLCFENMAMQGYVTEKIFDCLYSGCIPIYWGAGNIQDIVPSEAYIDFRNFYSYDDLSKYIENLTDDQYYEKHNAGRSFIKSIEFSNYFNSLENVFSC